MSITGGLLGFGPIAGLPIADVLAGGATVDTADTIVRWTIYTKADTRTLSAQSETRSLSVQTETRGLEAKETNS
jgi:hypothetical protein